MLELVLHDRTDLVEAPKLPERTLTSIKA